jgi:diacylglycerol kinase (ATP)
VKSKLIVNPAAGADAALAHLHSISSRLRATFGSLDIVITAGEGDAAALATAATEDGYERLFVAGGDGTLNEAINGVARVPRGLDTVTFGVIPLGTGNDFAHALGIPENVEDALDAVAAGTPTALDAALLNDVYFVNVSAGGYIADVSDAVTPRMKTLTGKLAYLIGGAQVLLDYDAVVARIDIRGPGGSDNTSLALRLNTFAVCNSRFIGGGQLIAPEARMDDGWLDVCLIEEMSTMDFVGILKHVAGGTHVDDERVRYFRAKELTLTFDRTISVNTDGQVREAEVCSYRVLPGAVKVLMP